MATELGRTEVFIDGRKAQGERTGVGHYTRQIIANWPDPSARVFFRAEMPIEGGRTRQEAVSGRGIWHVVVAWRALRTRALYFSPESMIVPLVIGRRAVITVHDITPISNAGVHTRWNVAFHRVLLRLTLKRVGAVIVPSGAVRDTLVSYSPSVKSKIHVIHEGLRDGSDPNGRQVDQSRPRGLYVGTIEPRKNVATLIRCFLDEARPEWTLVLVGRVGWLDDVQLQEFNSLLDEAGSRVEYRGYVSDEELLDFYRTSSAFFYVSSAEGFGLPVAEAMSFGLPVVHSDDPALVEVGGGAGIAVELDRLDESLRRAIRRVTNLTPEEQRSISENSIRRAASFDWGAAALETASLVQSGQRTGG